MDIPPLHPILVNFTAALFPVSVLSDLLGVLLRKESLRATGWWTLLFAAIVTPFTALAGWLWLRTMGDMDHGEMVIHQWLGISLAASFLLLALWRWRIYSKGNQPGVVYLGTVLIVLAALVVQGHLGGIMSFGTSATQPPMPASNHAPDEDDHQHGQRYEWKDHIDLKERE